ncbi:hypothetical protein [Paenibacillus hexagrammi]|uniref:Uncharacterized protein n=1 Tax=Paenibacillus hexagrammi TaxID=2908839 RepID=A0ABY3SC33_9BACL|nr:hypothetical protein [Paenibacillus sp. YPD9-1]UJF31567.1 hypothetical protein L0M14_17325 [Paenibacillus sp. YPD9-1]
MSSIQLRPDLKTAGGEVCDILLGDQFVGTLTLVYREMDRIAGSIQLEHNLLTSQDKEHVYSFVQSHIQHMIDALYIQDCEVVVTCSDYDMVIATEPARQSMESGSPSISRMDDDEADYEWVRDESRFDDVDPESWDQMDMAADPKKQLGYELVIVNEKRNLVEYHVYDGDSEIVAEAILHVYGSEVVGEIHWKFDPFDEEMDHVSELMVEDFDDEETDTFVFHMIYNGETIDTIELTHIDLLDDGDEMWSELEEPDRDDYSVILARDDGDTLTYEIYQQSYGGLPIGTATVDISQRQITGFIDFREPGSSDDRELIASLLLEELDKEKEYETVNLSMLFRNKLIDEILFETEHIH